jgi:tRNA uridine 5-carbamoylmethylation protein Kti12
MPGAAMLAKRWGSPRLIDLSEPVLQRLLAENELVERLKEMEDFRKLREDVNKIISQSQKVRAGKKTSASGEAVPDDPEIARIKKSKRDQVNTHGTEKWHDAYDELMTSFGENRIHQDKRPRDSLA